jgi:kynureninase
VRVLLLFCQGGDLLSTQSTHFALPADPALLDAADPLRDFRERFVPDESGLIYLDGNSLGRLPKATVALMQDVIERQWGQRLIRSWNEGWFDLSERIGAKVARLLGAREDEVIVADSTSVNLYKLALAALEAKRDSGRATILTDDLNFPSDIYVLQGIAAHYGGEFQVKVIPSRDGIHGDAERLCAEIDESVALVTLSHTCFKSAYTYDMAAINALAREKGAITLWDLSHSGGSVVVELDNSAADLAVGCTYKYLNGGPGAPAWLYVSGEMQRLLRNPISGWMSQRNLFDFGLEYAQSAGMRGFLAGTPPMLSLAAIEPGVDLLLEAGMENLRSKSVRQSEYMVALWEEQLAPLGYTLNSPRDVAWRGSHISLGHVEGWRIDQALIHRMNTLPDFRQPDNIRLGIAPLYNTFHRYPCGRACTATRC